MVAKLRSLRYFAHHKYTNSLSVYDMLVIFRSQQIYFSCIGFLIKFCLRFCGVLCIQTVIGYIYLTVN
jgi:hypothetical protein